MRSSTSSSKRSSTDGGAAELRRPGARHGSIFALTLILSTLAVHILWKNGPLADHHILEATTPDPPSADYYLSITDQNAIDGYVFMHQLEDVCAPLRSADVVFFGNSLVQFAFRGDVLRSFFEARGLTYYLLGFPNGSAALATRVLEGCDAQPRLAVVYETGFLLDQPTTYDESILDSDGFGARKARMEFDLAFFLRRVVHRILPHPVGRDLEGVGWIVYRSIQDGSWWFAAGNERKIPIDDQPLRRMRVPAADLLAAERFAARLENAGGEMLIGYVPTSAPATRHLARSRSHAVAAHLGLPVLDPPVSGLLTADGFHLTRESADRYALALTEQLAPFLESLSEAGSPASE